MNTPTQPIASRFRTISEVITLAAILATCVFLVWSNKQSPRPVPLTPAPPTPVPEAPISIDGAAVKGRPSAPVVMIEWSDYECPFCQKVEVEVLREVDRLYVGTGKMQIAFFHRPLTKIHARAAKAAEAASCANSQGKFWEMHAALFADPKQLDDASLVARARVLGLDDRVFSTCLAGEMSEKVKADGIRADTLQLKGTPAFLIGLRQADGRVKVSAVIEGAKPLGRFAVPIEAALEQAKFDTPAPVMPSTIGGLK